MLNDIWLKILPKHFCVFATVWHRQTYSSSVVLCLDGSGGRKVLRRATTTMIPSWVRSIGGLWCVLDGNQTWCLCLEWDTLYSAGVVDWWASPWFGSCPNFQSNGQWLYRHAGCSRLLLVQGSSRVTCALRSDIDNHPDALLQWQCLCWVWCSFSQQSSSNCGKLSLTVSCRGIREQMAHHLSKQLEQDDRNRLSWRS